MYIHICIMYLYIDIPRVCLSMITTIKARL